jgi:hypothetical protein
MSNANNNVTATLASAPDIRDIVPPVEIVNPWAWLWWALAVIVIVAAVIAFLKRRKRAAQIPAAPPIPAHVRAKQKLQEALALIAQPKPFVTAVSDAERLYLEERFNFRAPERTTEEFLHELARTDRLTRDQKESLGGFLASCDLVKFAKYEPGESELRELHRLVEETEPVATSANPDSDSSSLRTPHSALK